MHHRFTLLLIVGILVSCTTAVPTTLPAITLSPTTTESPTPIRSARPTSMQQPAHTLTPSPPKDWPTRLLSISPNGDPDIGSQAQLSDDGRYAVYESGFNIYLRDLDEDTTILVTVSPNGAAARGWSFAPSISADGSTVAFFSLAGNLLDRSQRVCPAEATCEGGALYLYDIASSTLTWIPVGTAEHILGDTALSADGRYVAFASPWAFFREGVYLYDRTTDALTTIVEGDIASQDSPIRNGGMAVDISADGRFVAFTSADDDIVPGDHKGVSDVFVFDRDTNRIQRISTPYNDIESDQPSGFQWIPATDGAFERGLSISADGRYVVFMSTATNLIDADLPPCPHWTWRDTQFPACRHIYLYDRETASMELISASDEGTPGNRASMDGDISADGRWVVFTSLANNLTANQPVRCIRSSFDGFCPQVFVRDRQESRTYLVSLDWNGQAVEAFAPALTSDGRYVTFVSAADHLAIDLPSIEDDPSWPVYTFISDLFALLDMQK